MELCQVPGKAREADISLLVEQYGDTLLRFCYLYLNDSCNWKGRRRKPTSRHTEACTPSGGEQ